MADKLTRKTTRTPSVELSESTERAVKLSLDTSAASAACKSPLPVLPVAVTAGLLEALFEPPLRAENRGLFAAVFLELLVDAVSLGGTLGVEEVRLECSIGGAFGSEE